jgi:hypothetical protein
MLCSGLEGVFSSIPLAGDTYRVRKIRKRSPVDPLSLSGTMQPLRRSILLLKEAPSGEDSESQGQKSSNRHQQQTQESDQYRSALHSLATDNVETTVDYLAPMATVFPESTALSEAIASGYPNTPFGRRRHQEDYDTTKSNDFIWAFAVTSQNAVHAIEAALTRQPHPGRRHSFCSPQGAVY